MANTPHPAPTRFNRLWPGLSLVVIIFLAGSVLYWIKGDGGKEASQDCLPASETVKALSPLAKGTIAALTFSSKPKPATPVTFEGPDGKTLSISDFKGKSLVLNLWATWCIPCREEMPALDQLQAKMGNDEFEVVTVNIDTVRLERRKAFLDEIGVSALAFYTDASADIFQRLKRAGKILGLPTTYLIDKNGCELGLMAGPANWSSEESLALISQLKSIKPINIR
jgi:thiol-disulfide isomerase/thioredoxin